MNGRVARPAIRAPLENGQPGLFLAVNLEDIDVAAASPPASILLTFG